MVRMRYRCLGCGRAFVNEPDAQIHVMDCCGGTDYEDLETMGGGDD